MQKERRNKKEILQITFLLTIKHYLHEKEII